MSRGRELGKNTVRKLPSRDMFDFLFRRSCQPRVCQYQSVKINQASECAGLWSQSPFLQSAKKEEVESNSCVEAQTNRRVAGEPREKAGRARRLSDCRYKPITFPPISLTRFDARAFIRAPVDPELLINLISAWKRGAMGDGGWRRGRRGFSSVSEPLPAISSSLSRSASEPVGALN